MTTIFDQLREVIERMCLSATSQTNATARKLAGANGSEAALGICSQCDAPRVVIRRRMA